jgi:hypothetical protein
LKEHLIILYLDDYFKVKEMKKCISTAIFMTLVLAPAFTAAALKTSDEKPFDITLEDCQECKVGETNSFIQNLQNIFEKINTILGRFNDPVIPPIAPINAIFGGFNEPILPPIAPIATILGPKDPVLPPIVPILIILLMIIYR